MKNILSTPASLLMLVLSVGLLSPLAEARDDDSECRSQALVTLANSGVHGRATLCTTARGVRAKIQTKGLTPGTAYTTWFFYFDNSSLCTGGGPGVCGGKDLGFGDPSANPLGVFGRLDSTVADENGKETFSGRAGSLRFSSGSQVWLYLESHGPAVTTDNRRLARQQLTPEDPAGGAPNLGNVVDGAGGTADAAIAIFDIP